MAKCNKCLQNGDIKELQLTPIPRTMIILRAEVTVGTLPGLAHNHVISLIVNQYSNHVDQDHTKQWLQLNTSEWQYITKYCSQLAWTQSTV